MFAIYFIAVGYRHQWLLTRWGGNKCFGVGSRLRSWRGGAGQRKLVGHIGSVSSFRDGFFQAKFAARHPNLSTFPWRQDTGCHHWGTRAVNVEVGINLSDVWRPRFVNLKDSSWLVMLGWNCGKNFKMFVGHFYSDKWALQLYHT